MNWPACYAPGTTRASGRMESHPHSQPAQVVLKKTPLGVPWIESDGIAPAIVFLASGGARMVYGAPLSITGGDSANVTA